MMKFIFFLFIVALSLDGFAQPKPVIPLMRKIFHENIDKDQKWIDRLDKKEDNKFSGTSDTDINLQINYTLYKKVDDLQNLIELDSTLDANGKIKYLRGLHEALSSFENGYRQKELKAEQFPDLVNAFHEAMVLEQKKASIAPIINDNDPEISNSH